MSGHSKWSKIKHQKETTDAAKGKIFTKCASAIIIAVKAGGGIADPEANFRLRLAIEEARRLNMPKENIERAIERAKGKGVGEELVEAIYEAFGPCGVGIIIEAATNNKQRTVAEIKNVLDRGGGRLATSGAVSHLFQYTGLISVLRGNKTFDEIMEIAVNSGATDIEDEDKTVDIYTNPADLHKVKEAVSLQNIAVLSFELIHKPVASVPVNDQNKAKEILRLLSALEEIEDVQKVFANFEIPDEYLRSIK